jgi:excisionase family DNA binding protein
MNKEQFAQAVGIGLSTLEKLMREGKVMPVKIGRRVLFRQHHVTELLDAFETRKKQKALKK